MMWRLMKFLVLLAVVAGLALIAYAYVGPVLLPDHFVPPARTIVAPVTLDIDG